MQNDIQLTLNIGETEDKQAALRYLEEKYEHKFVITEATTAWEIIHIMQDMDSALADGYANLDMWKENRKNLVTDIKELYTALYDIAELCESKNMAMKILKDIICKEANLKVELQHRYIGLLGDIKYELKKQAQALSDRD